MLLIPNITALKKVELPIGFFKDVLIKLITIRHRKKCRYFSPIFTKRSLIAILLQQTGWQTLALLGSLKLLDLIRTALIQQ